MNILKKIAITFFIVIALLECCWYIWLTQKKKQVERFHSAECTKLKGERVFTLAPPIFQPNEFQEYLVRWFESQAKLIQFRIEFIEKGQRKKDAKYQYDTEISEKFAKSKDVQESMQKFLQNIKYGRPQFNMFCEVNHDTQLFHVIVIEDVSAETKQLFERQIRIWTQDDFKHSDYAVPPSIIKMTNDLYYLQATAFILFYVDAKRSNLDIKTIWSNFESFVLLQEIEKKHDIAHRKYEKSHIALQAKQHQYKTRLPWYGLLLCLFILLSKGKIMARILKSLIGDLFSFKKDPTLDSLKVKLLRTQREITELTSLNRHKLKEAKREADKKIRAEKVRLSKKDTEKTNDININLISQYYHSLSASEKPDFISELVKDCQIPLKNQHNALQNEIVKLLESVATLKQKELSKAQRATVNSVQAQLQNLQNSEEFMKKQLKDFTKKLEALERETTKNSMIKEIDSLLEQTKDHVEFFQKLQKLKNKLVQKGISLNSQTEFQLLKKTIERSKIHVH